MLPRSLFEPLRRVTSGRPGLPVHSIHDTHPADRWEDAFLSGNGEVGIMVFGRPHRERIVHNHHRYVLPNTSLGMRPPVVAGRLEHVRDLVLAGERAQREPPAVCPPCSRRCRSTPGPGSWNPCPPCLRSGRPATWRHQDPCRGACRRAALEPSGRCRAGGAVFIA
ncbi:glycoside hydrolase N-terminal domain-containing protein [Streptomyces sp. Li-HN-5-11]|uniref:glycoside hydrolase N-terminal domain-containing protein n=1 Tax=Streptomyces sp. Li-HN-5-11 TaxID=3075432 RepID=UPI0037D9E521